MTRGEALVAGAVLGGMAGLLILEILRIRRLRRRMELLMQECESRLRHMHPKRWEVSLHGGSGDGETFDVPALPDEIVRRFPEEEGSEEIYRPTGETADGKSVYRAVARGAGQGGFY